MNVMCCGGRMPRQNDVIIGDTRIAVWICSKCGERREQALRSPNNNKLRIVYDFDNETQILESNLYEGEKLIMRNIFMPPKSLQILKILRNMKGNK